MEGLRDCRTLLFAMTPDSVQANSVCKQEWTREFKYKKPVAPLLRHPGAEMPFRLEPRQYIDFTGDFKSALAVADEDEILVPTRPVLAGKS